MLEWVKFYAEITEKAKDLIIHDARTDTGKAYNAGVDTLLSYVYIIATEMQREGTK